MQGATGTTGPKGEPGLGVNITEVKLYLKNENGHTSTELQSVGLVYRMQSREPYTQAYIMYMVNIRKMYRTSCPRANLTWGW